MEYVMVKRGRFAC